eukprot:scaffold8982_cov65-Phaeocystis_antarctica.AAC.11
MQTLISHGTSSDREGRLTGRRVASARPYRRRAGRRVRPALACDPRSWRPDKGEGVGESVGEGEGEGWGWGW